VATCQVCHGLGNGGGQTPGTNNNLPAGVTNSTTTTTASAATGVAAGTRDQISHADVNGAGRDCNFCHTQVGVSSAPGVQGKEWAQATFHARVPSPTMNGTPGRCSNCHLNVKPGPSFSVDHSGFTASSATDCSNCHRFPGGGSTTSPNWLGAQGGAPGTIEV